MVTSKSKAPPPGVPASLPRTPISAWTEIRSQIDVADEAMRRARQVLDAWFTLAPPAAWRKPFAEDGTPENGGSAQS